MTSLSELLTTRRTAREAKPTRKISLVVTGRRRPIGAFMPVSVCAAACLLVALVITLGIALRA